MSLTEQQVQQLLRPINTRRVLRDGKGHSHVSQQDILAHLIRVFGFGNFDIDVLSVDCVFESERADDKGVGTNRYDVCYRALVRVTIRDPQGQEVAHYENGSTATAQNQTRGDGHDLAYKSAISLSVKRACIALGDGFGLSLYNRGQTDPLVMGTLVHPTARPDGEGDDLQAEVPQQHSLGNDEVDPEIESEQPARPAKVSDLDKAEADRRGISQEQARQERLERERTTREALGTKSDGSYAKDAKRPTRSTGPAADDPWAS